LIALLFRLLLFRPLARKFLFNSLSFVVFVSFRKFVDQSEIRFGHTESVPFSVIFDPFQLAQKSSKIKRESWGKTWTQWNFLFNYHSLISLTST
jgi:hypothetical protein